MKITLHRASVAVATIAVTAGLALAPSAAQADPSPQATSAAQWLADQVPSGTHLFTSVYGEGEGESFVDYGLNLDLQHALDQLGESETADQVYEAVKAAAEAYTDAFGTRYAGSVGKLATYVQLHGDDPSAIDGRDLIEDLEGLMVSEGSEAGRLKDAPDGEYQSANTIGQSWGVRALAGAKSEAAQTAKKFLVDQQCDDGGFRLYQGGEACSSNVDATTFAIAALRDAGGFATQVDDAVDYLQSEQNDDGSLSEVNAPNSNSTGLAAVAFATSGASAAATKAADWVAERQATKSTDGLADEAGAIAFDASTFVAGEADGIGPVERDQWVRTTAQAALALNFASAPQPEPEPGPVASLRLKVSDSTPTVGDTVTVTATGKDADGTSTGDVSDALKLTSSVATDTVDGNRVTFNEASPHTITAVHTATGTSADVRVDVSALAAGDPHDDGGGGGDAGGGANDGDVVGDAALPDTGAVITPWHLASVAALLAVGTALVVIGRRRGATSTAHGR